MAKIVAIGGGEIENAGAPAETLRIDQEIVNLSEKTNPKLLFLPTASNDSEEYFEVVKNHFEKLGCLVDVLYLIKDSPSKQVIKDKIFTSDIIYVGGGKPSLLFETWQNLGVNDVLRNAYDKGILMSGLSLGSICWFKYSVFLKEGLDLIHAIHCPHFDVRLEKHRVSRERVKEVTQTTGMAAICLDECCAIEVVDDKYRIISSRDEANAYKAFWENGLYHEKLIRKEETFNDLKEITG